ncbi:MAG TPA: hypothetical protein VIY29_18775 [Ktedonobacteraceae bacterium]
MRWWADPQFLILALSRLRRATKIAYEVRLNVRDALIAAEELHGALRTAMKKVDHPQR